MAKLSNKGLLGIALVLSLVTSLLIYNYLQRAVGKADMKEGVPVVVAKTDIPAKTKITAEMVQQIRVPAEYLQPGGVQDLKNVVGVIAREPIVAGEQITDRRLVRESKSVGFTGMIPRDKRAVTVAVSEVTGVAGFVKPGDYVDVIVTFEQGMVGDNVSYMMLQNVLVLAANRDAEAGAAGNGAKEAAKDAVKATTVTLAVTPDEAAKLTLAEEKGKIRLALRPYLPLNGIEITNTITPKELVGVQYSPVQSQPSSGGHEVQPAAPVPPQYYMSPPQIQPAAPPRETGPETNSKGIQVIRGTKTENIPVN